MKHNFIRMFNKYDSSISRSKIIGEYDKILKFFERKDKSSCLQYLKKSSWSIDDWEEITKGFIYPLAVFIRNSILLSKNLKYQRPHSLGEYHSRFYKTYYELYYW